MIVGGLAVILSGNPRTTTDIDIIIENKPELLSPLYKAFKQQNFDLDEQQVSSILREGSNASIYDRGSIFRVDLKVARKQDEKEVLAQARSIAYQSINLQIASIEQILYGKILYLGDISDLSDDELLEYNDVNDFIQVFRKAKNVNMEWLCKKAKDKQLETTLRRVLSKAK